MTSTDANRLGRVGMISIHDAQKLDASVLLLMLNVVEAVGFARLPTQPCREG